MESQKALFDTLKLEFVPILRNLGFRRTGQRFRRLCGERALEFTIRDRVHRSTFVVGIIASLFFFLICFPSAPFQYSYRYHRQKGVYKTYHSRRGYPLVFHDSVKSLDDELAVEVLNDSCEFARFEAATYWQPRNGYGYLHPAWHADKRWRDWMWLDNRRVPLVGNAEHTRWLGLALDIAFGIIIVVVVCAAYETRRRRRRHILQLRITDLLGVMLLVAIVGSWWRIAARQRTNTVDPTKNSEYRQECWAPQCLKRLVGTEVLKGFYVPYARKENSNDW